MSKRIVLIFALISILSTLFGVAAAPVTANAGQRSVQLLSVGYYREKGVVFKFHMQGDFQGKEIKGSAVVDGKLIKVYCVRKDSGSNVNAQCVAASITSRLAGKQGVINFAGYSFSFIVPERNTPRKDE